MVRTKIVKIPIKQGMVNKGKRLKVLTSKLGDISPRLDQTNSVIPPGLTDEMIEVFYKSLIDSGETKPFLVPELDGYWPSDENLGADVEHVWGPILREPLLPFVCARKNSSNECEKEK